MHNSIYKRLAAHPALGAAVVLGVALVGGLLLRVGGADFCLPMEHCHPDEHWLYKPVLKMLRTGDLNPHFFVYPTLFMYLLLAVYALTFLVGVSAGWWSSISNIKTAPFLYSGRLTAGLLGTGTLIAVYAAGKRLADQESGAVAALALAVMPLHVSNSHFITTDVPAGFFCALALWAAAGVATGGNRRNYVIAGLLVGFATAAKYNAALVAINIPLAHWINARRKGFFTSDLLWALLWVGFGFLIANPYALFDMPRFLDGVAQEIAHYKRAHIGHEGEYNRAFYMVFLAGRGFGPVLAGLGVFGVLSILRDFRRKHLLLLVFPVLYILFLGSYKVRFVRNLMPILPYLSLWIGVGAVSAFREVRRAWPALGRANPWALAIPGLALALAIPTVYSVDETLAMVRPDTRLQAKEWIEKNVPRGKTIYLQAWSVDNLTPGKYRTTRDRWQWDYYVATDRLSKKYFAMKKAVPVKYQEVVEAYQHRPLKAFIGREENRFYCTMSPTVLIFGRDPSRPRVRAP